MLWLTAGALVVGCSDSSPRTAAPSTTATTAAPASSSSTTTDVRDVDLVNATIPVGACGTTDTGWPTTTPITLHDGKGVARLPDGSFDGASIMDSRVVGYVDLDGDGTTDALLSITCAGAPPEMCCASRAGILQFGLPLRRDGHGDLAIVGSAITGGGLPNAGRAIHTIDVAGHDVVTTETVIYPEGLTESDLGFPPDATITTTYRFVGGQWKIVSEHS